MLICLGWLTLELFSTNSFLLKNECRFLFSLLFVCFFTSGSYCQDVKSILDRHYEAWGQGLISTIRTYELEMSEVRAFLD